MIDFYIILIQRVDGLLERGVMDLDAQDWALITGRGEVGSFSPGSSCLDANKRASVAHAHASLHVK